MSRGDPKNAFERAEAAALRFRASWWSIASKALRSTQKDVYISRKLHVPLLAERPTVGSVEFDRRTVRYRPKGKRKSRTFVISRPTDFRLSSLPLEAVQSLANDIVAEAEEQWRQAAIEHLVQEARSQTHEDCLKVAQEVLGLTASCQELEAFAEQISFRKP